MKISVIVPVFNTIEYLEKCIESLLSQTLDHLELIFIDNGSTDGCYELLCEYQSKHENIIVKQVHGGRQGRCRNIALGLASGKYIGFADSDDWCDADMYETLFNLAESHSAEVALCQARIFQGNNNVVGKYYSDYFISDGLYNKSEHRHLTRMTAGWNKILRRDLLLNNHITFTEETVHEDVVFTFKAFFLANKIAGTSKVLYNYRKHLASSTQVLNTGKLSKSSYDIFLVIDDLKKLIKELEMPMNWQQSIYNRIDLHFSYLTRKLDNEIFIDYMQKVKAHLEYFPETILNCLTWNQLSSLEQGAPEIYQEIYSNLKYSQTLSTKGKKPYQSKAQRYKKRYQSLVFVLVVLIVLTGLREFI